ncbi:hypothetical protein Dsin_012037 [Dipteronia sinensis]|uniref:RNase H type-1 domain-containing protein n=1 Tax=Dipteronia sinensis TaxID=43782 RepID=A0AAE0AIM4_9ROSI|nr:hypothetical protein Dsin_012037 [Dipteronia sinensis]
MVKVGKNLDGEDEWAASFKCKKAKFPITYLGMPLGARPSSKAFWYSEEDSLWKKVIYAKYGAQPTSLIWKINVVATASSVVKAVWGLFNDDSLTVKILEDGLKDVQLMRRLFDWELDLWNVFSFTLGSVKLHRYMVTWWFKHHGKGLTESITVILENLKTYCVDVKPVRSSCKEEWLPLSNEELKFNVDGSVRRESGRAGIGGVLRNSLGEVLYSFSVFMGNLDANSTELLAIQKSLQPLCLKSLFGWEKNQYC